MCPWAYADCDGPNQPAHLPSLICPLTESLDTTALRKQALWKQYIENFTTKKWKLSDEKFCSFHISVQNIDCRYSLELPHQGSSNKYPQSMFLSRNKKINVYPCKPQFYYIKVGFKRVKPIYVSFSNDVSIESKCTDETFRTCGMTLNV